MPFVNKTSFVNAVEIVVSGDYVKSCFVGERGCGTRQEMKWTYGGMNFIPTEIGMDRKPIALRTPTFFRKQKNNGRLNLHPRPCEGGSGMDVSPSHPVVL